MNLLKTTSIIFSIIILTILYNKLFIPHEIFCEGDCGVVIGYSSGKYAFILGSVDEKSANCISESWGMNIEKIQLIFLSDNESALDQNKCMIDNLGKSSSELTKIWKKLCRAKNVKYYQNQDLHYSFSTNQLKVTSNTNDSQNYTHIMTQDSSKRKKHIYIFDKNDRSINTNKYKSESTIFLFVDMDGFLRKAQTNEAK